MNFNTKEGKTYLNSCGILAKWHDKELEDFTNDAEALKVVHKYLKKHKSARHKGHGLFLYGANGTGKTLLMTTAFKHLIKEGYKVKIVSMSTLITKFTAGWYSDEERASFQEMLKKVDFLGIEEIGKEYKSINGSDLANTVLDNIIRFRVQTKKPIWCTSNIEPGDIEGSYSMDVSSMLRECCLPLNVQGIDFRKEIAKTILKEYK